MAEIYNEQRRLGIRIVPDGTVMFNNQPVIGVREASGGVLFVDNQRVLGVDVLDADQPIYNEQPVLGAVQITDSRTMYNGKRVTPVKGGGVIPDAPAAFTAGQWSVSDAATGGTVTVNVTALPSNGGSVITAIQYQVGAGSWTNSGIASTGTFNITGLTNGVSVNIKVRAVNAVGNGPDSDTKSVTPTAGYDSDAQAWFNAMTVQPDSTRKNILNSFVVSMKSATWAPTDLIFLTALGTAQAANLNAKSPTGPYIITPVNSPVFTVDRGYAGDGSGAYLSTNYLFTDANQFSQDNASLRFYVVSTPSDGNNSDPVWGMDTTAGTLSFVRPKDGTGGMGGRINATVNDNSAAVGTRLGYKALVRIDANTYQFYGGDGLPLGGTLTRASAAMQAKELLVFRLGTGYGRDQVGFLAAGGAPTSAQILAERNALTTYFTAIGAI